MGADSDPSRLAAGRARILAGEGDADDVDAVARAWVDAVAWGDDGAAEAGPADERALLRRLVEQTDVAIDPPALHTVLANYASGGVGDVLAAAAARLGPELAALVAAGHPHKNVVLMLLVLRAHLGGHVDQGTITDLHLRTIGDLTTADITLPYSTAFSREFDLNRDDVERLVAGAIPGRSVLELPLPHVLVFEWLTGTPGGARSTLASRISSPAPSPAATEAEATAAARSLLVHHQALSDVVDAVPGLVDDAVRTLCHDVATRRATLPAATAPTEIAAVERARGRLEARPWLAVHAALGLVESRAPRTLRRRRPKVAVCVSGQLRGYRAALESWRRTILRAADCDVYLHTWEKVGRSSGEAFRATLPFAGERFATAYREVANRVGFEEVKERHPHLFATLATSGTVTADELSEVYDTPHVQVEDDVAPPRDRWTNQDKMHSKIEAAFEMIEPSPEEYDLVIRLRPDKPIRLMALDWGDVLTVCRSSPTILADAAFGVHYAHLVIGDQFAIGGPAAMAVYSRTWSTYAGLAEAGLFDCPEALHGHSSLAHVCWAHGIDVRRAPLRFGDLAEAEPMSSTEVLACLRDDASGRDDEVDRRLIAAAAADIETD